MMGRFLKKLRGGAKFITENTAFYLDDTEINHHLLGSFEQIRLNFVVGVVFLPQCSQRFHKGAH